ncbi:hypothetical protein MAR_014971 [Mya arenaria]|uniref:Uncharacterized protein n=1 Tax=Mya arenaria TaxID=6604 RepID=A0ABY7FIX3_MYAAR|nr:hypothetical protein MAR_014971 [Mya arenaria]
MCPQKQGKEKQYVLVRPFWVNNDYHRNLSGVLTKEEDRSIFEDDLQPHFLPKDHFTVDVSGILSSTDPDFLSDVDSHEDFQVMAVQSVYCYNCCDRPAINSRQVINPEERRKCSSCNNMPDTEQHYGSAMVILKKRDRFLQVRFFMDNLKTLFKVDDITYSNKLLQQLKTQVPVTGRDRFTNTGVEILSVKRRIDA